MSVQGPESDLLGVDVVIPTFRRAQSLKRCLEALENQTIKPNSIQVIDDSEDDRGPAFTRNIGWRRGKSPIVAFTDDDCVPSPNWIETIVEAFSDGDTDAVEGSVKIGGEDEDLSMDPHPKDRWNRFKTANMAYKREVLEAVGGFDERYFIHREDTDIAWRAINSGFSISWAPRCVVNHPDRGGVQRMMPRSEILLFRCDKKKYVEVASGMISVKSLRDGRLKEIRRQMRTYRDDFVTPLSRWESLTLWSRSFVLAVMRKIGAR
jgi:hypothetical protein